MFSSSRHESFVSSFFLFVDLVQKHPMKQRKTFPIDDGRFVRDLRWFLGGTAGRDDFDVQNCLLLISLEFWAEILILLNISSHCVDCSIVFDENLPHR